MSFTTIRTINGKPFPQVPMEFSQDVFTVDRDSYDDLEGNLQRPSILGERDKFEFILPPLHSTELKAVLNELKKSSITLEYEDFWDSSIIRTGTFYHGDLTKSTLWIKSSTTLYDKFAFNLISYKIRKISY